MMSALLKTEEDTAVASFLRYQKTLLTHSKLHATSKTSYSNIYFVQKFQKYIRFVKAQYSVMI